MAAAAEILKRWPDEVDLDVIYVSMGAGSLVDQQIIGFDGFARQWREYGKFYMLNGWLAGMFAYKTVMLAAGDTARAGHAQGLIDSMWSEWRALFTPQSQFPIYSMLFNPPWNGGLNWLEQRTYNTVRSWIFISPAVVDLIKGDDAILAEARSAVAYHRSLSPVGFAPFVGYAGECNITNLQGYWLTIADALLGGKTQVDWLCLSTNRRMSEMLCIS